MFHFKVTLGLSWEDTHTCWKPPHGGASSLSMVFELVAFFFFPQTKIEWLSKVVAGQGLQEVQAHPDHTEKVIIVSQRNRYSFSFEESAENASAGGHDLLLNHRTQVLHYEIWFLIHIFRRRFVFTYTCVCVCVFIRFLALRTPWVIFSELMTDSEKWVEVHKMIVWYF